MDSINQGQSSSDSEPEPEPDSITRSNLNTFQSISQASVAVESSPLTAILNSNEDLIFNQMSEESTPGTDNYDTLFAQTQGVSQQQDNQHQQQPQQYNHTQGGGLTSSQVVANQHYILNQAQMNNAAITEMNNAKLFQQNQQQQQIIFNQQRHMHQLQQSLAEQLAANSSNNNSLTETEDTLSTNDTTISTKKKKRAGKAQAAPQQPTHKAAAVPTLTLAQKFGLHHSSITGACHLMFKPYEHDINHVQCIFCEWHHIYNGNEGPGSVRRHCNGKSIDGIHGSIAGCRFGKPGYILFGDSLLSMPSKEKRLECVQRADDLWKEMLQEQERLAATKAAAAGSAASFFGPPRPAASKQTTLHTEEGQWKLRRGDVTVNGARMRIAQLIFMTNQPFSFSEEKYFRDLIWYFDPTIKLTSRFTVARDIHHIFKVYKDVIKGVLQRAKSKGTLFGVTTDIWSTKCQKRAYMAITLHCCHDDFEHTNMLLDFMEVDIPHSGENIARQLFNSLEEFGIVGHVLTIVGDNASNQVKAVEEYSKLAAGRMPFGGVYILGRCLAHIINLVTQAALAILKPFLVKLRAIMRHLVTPQQVAAFNNFVALYNPDLQSRARPKIDCKTRWDSCVEMLILCLLYQKSLDAYGGTIVTSSRKEVDGELVMFRLRLPRLLPDEWKFLKAVMKLLLPFKSYTKILCVNNEPSMHHAFEICSDITTHLATYQNTVTADDLRLAAEAGGRNSLDGAPDPTYAVDPEDGCNGEEPTNYEDTPEYLIEIAEDVVETEPAPVVAPVVFDANISRHHYDTRKRQKRADFVEPSAPGASQDGANYTAATAEETVPVAVGEKRKHSAQSAIEGISNDDDPRQQQSVRGAAAVVGAAEPTRSSSSSRSAGREKRLELMERQIQINLTQHERIVQCAVDMSSKWDKYQLKTPDIIILCHMLDPSRKCAFMKKYEFDESTIEFYKQLFMNLYAEPWFQSLQFDLYGRCSGCASSPAAAAAELSEAAAGGSTGSNLSLSSSSSSSSSAAAPPVLSGDVSEAVKIAYELQWEAKQAKRHVPAVNEADTYLGTIAEDCGPSSAQSGAVLEAEATKILTERKEPVTREAIMQIMFLGEIERWENLTVCPPRGASVLEWWKLHAATFPILSTMARNLLSVPATSAASESIFSKAKRVIEEHRASLHPDTVRALMCTKSYLEEGTKKKWGLPDELDFTKNDFVRESSGEVDVY